MDDPTQTEPDDIEGFKEAFVNLCTSMEEMMIDFYRTISSSIDETSMKPVHDKQTQDTVVGFLRQGSSVSMIDYKAVSKDDVKAVATRGN